MSWSITGILDATTDYFRKKGIDSPRINAEWLLVHVLNFQDRIRLYLEFDKILLESEIIQYRNLIQRRIRGEPLQYIIGHTQFFHVMLKLNSDVLIPRPETEQLVEKAVERIKQDDKATGCNILELGTGSGAIPIALAHALPHAGIWSVDRSISALQLARQNAIANHVDHQIRFWAGDRFEALQSHLFDYIISNPPYVTLDEWRELPSEVRDFEPSTALIADQNGMSFYYYLIGQIDRYLKKTGWMMLEIGETQLHELEAFIRSQPAPLNPVFSRDYNHKDRFIFIQNP